VLLPDIEDVFPGEYLASAHRDVLDENRGGVALLEELAQICRTLLVLGIVREFFAEGDHANDVLGR